MFKSNLNKISRERHNSEEQNNELQNIELLCDAQEAVIKSLIVILQYDRWLNTIQFIENNFHEA